MIAVFITAASLKAQTSLKRPLDYVATTQYASLLANYTNSNIFDTVTAPLTTSLISSIIKGFQKTVQVAFYVKKISGADVTGTATLQGSIDGIRFYPISTDTVNIIPQIYTYGWKITDWSNLYLRVAFNITSSSTVEIGAHYFARKEEHAN